MAPIKYGETGGCQMLPDKNQGKLFTHLLS